MYCRNCGKELTEEAAICTECGVPKGSGSKFCNHCGKETAAEAVFCTSCGCALSSGGYAGSSVAGQKSKLVAGLIAILLGLGIHNFYLGYTGKAVAQLLLSFCGIGYIWCLIEGIMILVGSINTDAKGIPLKD